MAQPSGQLALASGHSSEYFWYAQGTGIWDAKNSAMLSKTGSAGMSTNGGANVALGNGSTWYALSSTVTKSGDYTLIVRAKVNTGAGTAGMALGDPVGGLGYCWLREDNNEVKMIMGSGGADFFTGSVNTLATWAFVHSGTDVLTYKDGTLVNTATGQTSTLTITKLLSGYAGDAFALSGEFEFAHVVPSALDSTAISALASDPYSVLAAGGGTNASDPGGTGTSTGSGTGGDATGGSGTNASDPGGTGTSTGSGTGGTATGGGSGSFTFDACENNTHSGLLSGVAVNWAWHSGGNVGSGTTITNGSGTMTTSGMTVSGLPAGVGYGVIRTSDGMVVGYQEGTVT